ncbi:hypothetical protein ACHAWC_011302 [Mediolabrus comicus]
MSNTEHYTITGVALSNETILILCTFGFATLGITLFLILRNQPKYDEEDERLDRHRRDNYGDELDKADAATLNRAQRRARAKYKMKQARRDMAPVVQVAARAGDDDNNDNNIAADEGRLDDDDVVVVDNNIAEGNPNRRERQRLAKQMERKERKMYSLEAQRWREKNSVEDTKSKTKKNDDGDRTSTQNVCMVEDIFPQRLDNNDPLSDIIFWEAIISSIKSRQHDDTQSSDELISQLQSRTMTVREFIERVDFDGSVSIIDLADEWDISIPDALREIEQLKELYNISGVVDSSGNYSILEIKAA